MKNILYHSFFGFSHLIGSKNYAVQLEKMTTRQFQEKGQTPKNTMLVADDLSENPGYFQFPAWQSRKWDQFKKDFGEGPSPIDKIESTKSLYTMIYVLYFKATAVCFNINYYLFVILYF